MRTHYPPGTYNPMESQDLAKDFYEAVATARKELGMVHWPPWDTLQEDERRAFADGAFIVLEHGWRKGG